MSIDKCSYTPETDGPMAGPGFRTRRNKLRGNISLLFGNPHENENNWADRDGAPNSAMSAVLTLGAGTR